MTDSATTYQDIASGFRLTMMYHPSHHVTDLAVGEEFFERVFGRPSTPLAAMGGVKDNPDYPTNYSTFTPINDVLFDMIDPKKYVLDGVQRYASVDKPHLKGFGWYVEGIVDAYRSLREYGIEMVGQQDEVADGDDPPTAPGSPLPIFFTVPSSAGMRYEFLPQIPFPLDPRVHEGWTLPPVSDDDPLGIEFCSHHTVLTDKPERALQVVRDALGGRVIHAGYDEVIGGSAVRVQLADSVLSYVIPDEGTSAHADWMTTAPDDTYHAITFKVIDLDRVARHLEATGVSVAKRTADTIVTEPADSLGVPWGFTTVLTPGDTRASIS